MGCAAVLGAAVAFPAGIILAGRDPPPQRQVDAPGRGATATRKADARDHYSPRVATDPYVVGQHRRVVEALELECRQFGKHCPEARQARQRLDEVTRD